MRAFRLLVTLAAVATSALGQNLTPTVGPTSSGTQSAASIPDFSGVWSHPFLTGFEPPQSGETHPLRHAALNVRFQQDRTFAPTVVIGRF